ncbi:hypothetical protein BC827DRAFT_1238638 [Russula dissimulans]|nr:hypothetical protein BC827DRAFT_1238638 [Russula dissimulans]
MKIVRSSGHYALLAFLDEVPTCARMYGIRQTLRSYCTVWGYGCTFPTRINIITIA